ncbi:Hypothetical Protein FCC1311_090662 [Hondaea fermentalgiana]|uniref:RIB43A-like with coiled-coils protein 2 n=1 Tax=Hondaea fermentalgiana TaxID=2315210 RepID=A0A2R5GWQ6_9STRA|nr:Hypothetical Protein FCC1311_090662 [Hondaea fermentalgiana]|eukprot:GBG32841.1 Hypothetical Protein FCC1311_090662 [Hondaea fermentalgiana]
MFHSWPAESSTERQAALRLEAKKSAKEDRRTRFLASKQRAIGIDVHGLDQQLEDKRRREEDERLAKAEEDEQTIKIANALKAAAAAEEAARREHRHGLQEYWTLQHRNRMRRPEADLNDPRMLQKDRVPTIETVGTSAAQFFEGDKELVERAELEEKMREQHALIDAKVADNKRLLDLEAQEEAIHAQIVKEQVRLRTQAEAEDARNRREHNLEVRRTNERLDALRKEQARLLRESDEERAKLEHMTIRASMRLREDRRERSDGRGGVRQEWKGMTPAQLADVKNELDRQAAENADVRAAEAKEECELDESIERMRQLAVREQHRRDQEYRDDAVRRRQFQESQKAFYDSRQKEQKDYDTEVQPEWWPFGRSDR